MPFAPLLLLFISMVLGSHFGSLEHVSAEPVNCLSFELGNKATSLVGLTSDGTLLTFNSSSGLLMNTHDMLIPPQNSTLCTLEGHGLYFFVYLVAKNQVVKFALSTSGPPSISSVMQLTVGSNFSALMYNSLGNGYLFSPQRIVPLNFFRGIPEEANTTLLPSGSYNDAAIDIWAGYRKGQDSNIWVLGSTNALVFACNTNSRQEKQIQCFYLSHLEGLQKYCLSSTTSFKG